MDPNYVEEIIKQKDLLEQINENLWWAVKLLSGAIAIIWGAMMYSWKLSKKNTESLIKALEEGHKGQIAVSESLNQLDQCNRITGMKVDYLQKCCDEVKSKTQ